MKSYILEKQSKKSFGPFDNKDEAQAELARVLEMVAKASTEVLNGVTIDITEQIDEWVVASQGNTIARYEIVDADQFDHPEDIPPEFQ